MTAPDDPRLPNAGQQVCGLYDLNPASFGQVRNDIVRAEPAGYAMEQVFDGLDVTVNSRVSSDLFLCGGSAWAVFAFDDCGARTDSPAAAPVLALTVGSAGTGGWDSQEAAGLILPKGHHCRVSPPFSRPGWKLSGTYTLPRYDVRRWPIAVASCNSRTLNANTAPATAGPGTAAIRNLSEVQAGSDAIVRPASCATCGPVSKVRSATQGSVSARTPSCPSVAENGTLLTAP